MSTAQRGVWFEGGEGRRSSTPHDRTGSGRARLVLGAPGSLAKGVRRRRTGPGGLTRREVEVLQLVSSGMTNRAVARALWVTSETVKFHLSNIYRKLDVSNRAEASEWAHENGVAEFGSRVSGDVIPAHGQ
jgi:DNA-binding CsgD family transcriptional regulator